MESVRIETAHNVALQMEVATIVDRGLAVLIDWLVLAGWSIAVGQLFNALDLAMPDWLGVVLFAIPWTFYHLLCEVLMDGQSIGKRARNIKVVRLDGAQPGIGNYLLRWVLRLVDTLFFLGAVVILFNGKGQRICHMPGQEYYEQTQISESRGERWFCSESEARAAGWRAARPAGAGPAVPAPRRRGVAAAWFPSRIDRPRAAPAAPANGRHPVPPARSSTR